MLRALCRTKTAVMLLLLLLKPQSHPPPCVTGYVAHSKESSHPAHQRI